MSLSDHINIWHTLADTLTHTHTHTHTCIGSIRSTSSLHFVLCSLWYSQWNLQNKINTSEWRSSRYRQNKKDDKKDRQSDKEEEKDLSYPCVCAEECVQRKLRWINQAAVSMAHRRGGTRRAPQLSIKSFPLQLRLFSGSRSRFWVMGGSDVLIIAPAFWYFIKNSEHFPHTNALVAADEVFPVSNSRST